tara:strand:- start:376 stop:831 length:456 start_codon:yes stop_codon:yes gene_type:complete
MDLKEKIDNQYKNSIKEKDTNSVNTLRLIKSAIKDKEISLRGKKDNLDNEDILNLLQSLIKQRKDSIESFEKANRPDLIDKEKSEINVIELFLPKQLDENTTRDIIKKIVEDKKLNSLKDMGSLMNILKTNYVGQIDMGLAGKIAKLVLGK